MPIARKASILFTLSYSVIIFSGCATTMQQKGGKLTFHSKDNQEIYEPRERYNLKERKTDTNHNTSKNNNSSYCRWKDESHKRDFLAYVNQGEKDPREAELDEEDISWEEFLESFGLKAEDIGQTMDEAQKFFESIEDKMKDYQPLRKNKWMKRHNNTLRCKYKPGEGGGKAKVEFTHKSDDIFQYPYYTVKGVWQFLTGWIGPGNAVAGEPEKDEIKESTIVEKYHSEDVREEAYNR